MRKFLLIALLSVTLLSGSITLSGCSNYRHSNAIHSNELKIILNGKNIANETTVVTKNDDFYIPIHVLCNSTNTVFNYNSSLLSIETVTHSINSGMRIGEASLSMDLNNNIVRLNSGKRKAEKMPFIEDNIIYIPLCYTMKLLGYKVDRKNNLEIVISHAELPTKKQIENEEEVFYVYYEYDDTGNLVKETSADSTYFLYEYNDKGKLIKVTGSVSGFTIERTYWYNENGTYAETYSNGPDGTYYCRYDNNGNIIYQEETSSDYETMYTESTYDNDGRLIHEKRKTDDGRITVTITEYTEHARIERSSTSDGDEISTLWAVNGIYPMRFASESLKSINYNEEDNMLEVITDTTSRKWIYDQHNRLVKEEYGNSNNTVLYEYDAVGNLLAINSEDIYKYDKDGNMIELITHSGGEKYEYDQYNRLCATEIFNSNGERYIRTEYIYE